MQNQQVLSVRKTGFVMFVVLCFGISLPGQTPTVSWSEPTRGVSIAVDRAGSVFTLDYETNLGTEMSLSKRDVNGNLLWVSSFDQTDPTKWERAAWVEVDEQGNAVVCGTLMSGYSNPVTAASIVMKFDTFGTMLWRQVYESTFDGSLVRKCVVDASGSIYVVGLGSGPSGYVTKIKKFSGNGVAQWSYFDAAGIGAPVNLKLAPDGHLIVAARATIGSLNGYAKIDASTGTAIWSLGGVQSLTVGDAAGDSFGNTYVVHGQFSSSGGCVLRKLSPSGVALFQTNLPLAGFRVECGPDDQPILSGFPNSNSFGAAFAKTDATGNVLWINLDADGPLSLLLHAHMLVDRSNDAYLAAGTLFEMAVCKVNANGSSAYTLTSPGGSYASALALSRNDQSLYVVGGRTLRILDPAEGPWRNLGNGLSGQGQTPNLFGTGTLAPASAFALDLEQAPAFAPALLGLGLTAVNLPLLGGTQVPAADFVISGILTSAAGSWQLPMVWPLGVAPGFRLYAQIWLADVTGPQGFVASNGLELTAP